MLKQECIIYVGAPNLVTDVLCIYCPRVLVSKPTPNMACVL